MKIPSNQGPVSIYGSQEAARRAKGSGIDSIAIHNIDEAEAQHQQKHMRDKATSVDQLKAVLLCEEVID
jgi:ribosomal protein L32E